MSRPGAQQWLENIAHPATLGHQYAGGDAEERGQEKAARLAEQRQFGVVEQVPLCGEPPKRCQRIAERRKQRRIEQAGARRELP